MADGGSIHSAVGPKLGYDFQAPYALLLLLNSNDNNVSVNVEGSDDVVLQHSAITEYHQVKHSISKGSPFSEKSDDLWKTLRIWSGIASSGKLKSSRFVLATVAKIISGNVLEGLRSLSDDRSNIHAALIKEAERVVNERNNAQLEGKKKLPHHKKYKGCEDFLALSDEKQLLLLERAIIRDDLFQITDVPEKISAAIKNSIPENYIPALTRRLKDWWNGEVEDLLTNTRATPFIHREEVTGFLFSKIKEVQDDGFVDDMESIDIAQYPEFQSSDPIHTQQLSIIKATERQVTRSNRTLIRAKVQKSKWIADNFGAATKLQKYQNKLVEEWEDFFEIKKENDISPASTAEHKEEFGRTVLDWSHNEAPSHVKRIHPNWENPDLVRGSYQMLASSLDVGWHPEFKELVKMDDDSDDS